jgi:hypothetical protein
MHPSEVALLLDDLEDATRHLFKDAHLDFKAIHSQYWIAGEVCRRVNEQLGLRHVHHMLSFGRQKRNLGEQQYSTDSLRDKCEVAVVNAVDVVVAQCPSEARDLVQLYPEMNHKRIAIIPHGIDLSVFN